MGHTEKIYGPRLQKAFSALSVLAYRMDADIGKPTIEEVVFPVPPQDGVACPRSLCPDGY